jgi:hypothetical protein
MEILPESHRDDILDMLFRRPDAGHSSSCIAAMGRERRMTLTHDQKSAVISEIGKRKTRRNPSLGKAWGIGSLNTG